MRINQSIAISMETVEKSFKDVPVLKGVSLSVKQGSIFALLGSNGAVKTTAIKILSTLICPDKGRAIVSGYDVMNEPDKVREQISLTGQFTAVDEALTGRDNLGLIGALRHLPDVKGTVTGLLEQFGLEDAANRKVSTYSGGMRRRLDIAMSIMGNPSVIFLDEPTTGLDPQNRSSMWNIVKSLAQNGTSIESFWIEVGKSFNSFDVIASSALSKSSSLIPSICSQKYCDVNISGLRLR